MMTVGPRGGNSIGTPPRPRAAVYGQEGSFTTPHPVKCTSLEVGSPGVEYMFEPGAAPASCTNGVPSLGNGAQRWGRPDGACTGRDWGSPHRRTMPQREGKGGLLGGCGWIDWVGIAMMVGWLLRGWCGWIDAWVVWVDFMGGCVISTPVILYGGQDYKNMSLYTEYIPSQTSKNKTMGVHRSVFGVLGMELKTL